MADQTTRVKLNLDAGPESDAEELEELTRQLWTELRELDVEVVDLVRAGEIPATAKVGDPITWGVLLLELAASCSMLPIIINAIHSWLTRHERRRVTLEIGDDKLELMGISSKQQKQLIDTWINRHTCR